jgi:hypothetical protein
LQRGQTFIANNLHVAHGDQVLLSVIGGPKDAAGTLGKGKLTLDPQTL